MKFSVSAVLALSTLTSNSDAFLSPTTKMSTITSAMYMSDDQSFLDALSPGKKDDNNEESEDSGSGSTRFQDMMKAAKQSGGAEAQREPTPIMNPFINPVSSPQPTANLDDLSVEDQARMFREMMAGKQQSSPPPADIYEAPIEKVARGGADRAGRPAGRNRDADMIANASDLYFAQLKRDSTVRIIGRIEGDTDVSESVFADEGIEQLSGLLKENPYLKSQKEEELALYESLPDEMIRPYFETKNMAEADKIESGISYKQKLMERRNKNLKGTAQTVSSPPETPKQEEAVVNTVEVTPPPPPSPVAEPTVVPQMTTPPPPPPPPSPVAEPPVVPQMTSPPPQQQQQPTAPTAETTESTSIPNNPEEIRQQVRTLMGLTLKHRGGTGFGRGRLKGQDIDQFEGLLKEVTTILKGESQLAQPVDKPTMSLSAVEPVPVLVQAAAAASVETINIDGTIACIEGAITMYKNSPASIQDSVLSTLRVALVSAVDTCNTALASQPAPSIAASPDARIEGTIACIEGVIAMYKNSPPQLKESMLTTLRAALISAVETCNVVIGDSSSPLPPPPVVPTVDASPTQTSTSSSQVSQPPQAMATDPNSKALEEIYEKVKAASGDGNLGLRSDLTAAEATDLADQLVDMRSILMEELDSGIPEPVAAVSQESSTSSRYQEMLAKARSEKAK